MLAMSARSAGAASGRAVLAAAASAPLRAAVRASGVPPTQRRHAAPPRLRCRCSSSSSSVSATAETSITPPAGSATAAPPAFDAPHFSQLPLDRAAGLRKDDAELQRLLASPSSRVVLAHRGKLLVGPASSQAAGSSGSGTQLALQASTFAAAGAAAPGGVPPRWLPLVASGQQLLAALEQHGDQQDQQQQQQPDSQPLFLFLGVDTAGAAVFAAHAPPSLLSLLPPLPPPRGASPQEPPAVADRPINHGSSAAVPDGACWVDVRNGGQQMAAADAAVAALVVGLAQWHETAAFCSRSGAQTVPTSGGHSRTPVAPTSSSSGRRPRAVYPRIDPAVIVAVSCGDWLLLGRKAAWQPGRYSCLAGFMEVGETLEQAVAREVQEESGVAVDARSARYVASQPWPFPQSLMIGFIAEAPPAPPALGGPGATAAPPPRGLNLLAGPGAVAACDVGLLPSEAERYLLPRLAPVQVDADELEDARWFHADWLAAQLRAAGGGGAPPAVVRGGAEGQGPPFRIPGEYALANRIIRTWLHERQQARAWPQGGSGAAAAAAVDAIPDVGIDQGSFKYVLLRLSTPDGLHSKLLVRGDSRAAYHNHIFQATAAEVRAAAPDAGLRLEALGGGRIEHYPEQRVASVFGFSSAYGQAPHDVTAALLRRWLPRHDIEVSYDGY